MSGIFFRGEKLKGEQDMNSEDKAPEYKGISDLLSYDNDLSAFHKLYKRFNIDLIINVNEKGYWIIIGETGCYEDGCIHSYKFEGYSCFFSSIYFDKNGKFINQGFWE